MPLMTIILGGGQFPAALEGKPDMLGLPVSFVPRVGAGGGGAAAILSIVCSVDQFNAIESVNYRR
jgi:hypothetical protein